MSIFILLLRKLLTNCLSQTITFNSSRFFQSLAIFHNLNFFNAFYGWAAWVFQLLIFASVFTLRYYNSSYKNVKRQYQVPILFVALNILAAASVVFLPIIDLQVMTFLIAGSLLVIGLVFYFYKPLSDDFDKTAVLYIQQLLQIA